jgi:exonuclease VII small subunit
VNDAEKRIQTVINNYRKGAYSLDQLKDLLDEGLQHIDAVGVKNVKISFIKSLAQIEEAIKRIENAKMRNTA